ncbi:MAG: M28 family peptidase [Flavobacterium sp.]|nr:MAG: M28 family peptidase [Flavobacterium sp.]
MKERFCAALLSLSCIGCFGQKIDATAVKYMKTITANELKEHLYIVASDKMEGRETGSEGQKKAGKYLIEQYKKDNIPPPANAPDYYQKIPAAYLNAKSDEGLNDSENIVAFIEGSEKPEEILVISAHYDHVGMKGKVVYNGADDDGSGTVALLEIAEAFALAKKDGHGPKRSILFLHVTGEEHGLHGSRFYSENPLFPLASTIADLNIDMIGRHDALHKSSSEYVYVIGSKRLSTDLYNAVEAAGEQYVNLKLDYRYDDNNDPEQFYYRSDHYNFAKNGIPVAFFFSGVHEDYHKPGDKANKIEYNILEERTQLAFATAWILANADKRPVVDKAGN